MKLSDFLFEPLSKETNVADFDCDDSDINEFLKKDALFYKKERLFFTYVFLKRDDKSVVAFFSISNNCLKDEGEKEKSKLSKQSFYIHNTVPLNERIQEYPGVLIGRLGVDKKYQGRGLGHELMKFIKGWVYQDHKPAFRLLMLDAYNRDKQMSYYKKNGFVLLLDNDTKDVTRLMFFDMLTLFGKNFKHASINI